MINQALTNVNYFTDHSLRASYTVLKVDSSDYDYYAGSSSYYNYIDEYYEDNEGYCYIATVDYVAYQKGNVKEEIIAFEEYTCRDIVANILKEEGYINLWKEEI